MSTGPKFPAQPGSARNQCIINLYFTIVLRYYIKNQNQYNY